MLFTERNYRSLALLCRFLAERFDVPRNFPLLPYLDNARNPPDRADSALFRRLILSDQRRDAIAQKLGTTTEVIQANGAAYSNFYSAANRAQIWSRFFGVTRAGNTDLPGYKGFLSHAINGGHSCPGPLFDWHRFARDVWDWWWYPFDFDISGTNVSITRRPYRQARLSTPLVEYYYDANGAANDYDQLREAPGPFDVNPTEKFRLPQFAPVYAMANGVVVAARFAQNSNPNGSGFLLVRHEVFHQRIGDRIDYDRAPSFVWSLIYFLENAGFDIPAPPPALPGATSGANPDRKYD
jgi:hypothetical protein